MTAPLVFRPAARGTRSLRVCIFGAAPATGNLGVTALCHSLVAGIARRDPDADITVFDDRPGVRTESLVVDDRDVHFRLCGAIPTRRLYRRDSLWRLRAESRLGFGGAPGLEAIRQADAVFDVTGGDSFTDLYGRRRLARGLHEKLLVLGQGRPLVLAPQTIGPFAMERARRAAATILRAASMVWCRDKDSLVTLRALLGADLDPERHRLGVDVAFALPTQMPTLTVRIREWLDGAGRRPVVGLNVSGLLLNDEAYARRRFALRADYRTVVSALLNRLLGETDQSVLIIPHVITSPGHHEHDPDAARAIVAALEPGQRSRVAIVEDLTTPAEAKWVISRCDWLCATRMHAAIAALSSGVPAAALAYSSKTSGVFAQCGLKTHVADLRRESTDAIVDRLWDSFSDRHRTRADLSVRLPNILNQADSQLDVMIDLCWRARAAETTTRRTA